MALDPLPIVKETPDVSFNSKGLMKQEKILVQANLTVISVTVPVLIPI